MKRMPTLILDLTAAATLGTTNTSCVAISSAALAGTTAVGIAAATDPMTARRLMNGISVSVFNDPMISVIEQLVLNCLRTGAGRS
jgi:hypothetical protein